MAVRADTSTHGSAGTVLLIDDDADVRDFIKARLESDGFSVVVAASGEQGLSMMAPDGSIDAVVIDVGLPGIDGFTVVRSLRRWSNVPIIMVTAASDEADRVLGLELGADDYVVKPFLPRELVARIRAAVRRSIINVPATVDENAKRLVFGPLVIDCDAHEAHVDGTGLLLTAREFDLLAFVATSPRRVFSREQLLRGVWSVEPGWLGAGTVTEHVHRLRKELERHIACSSTIATVRGAGYRFDP